MSVDAVTIKLSVFWSTSPSAWFTHAEAQFAIRSITQDDTRYYHVVSVVDSAAATCALSLLWLPPNTRKYETIKTFWISAYELSNYERASSLFGLTGLSDSKPSEFMDSMLVLLGNHNPCFLFKHLLLQQLPNVVRGSLANYVVNEYRSFAEANKMYHAGWSQGQHLQEVSNKQSSPARSKVIDNYGVLPSPFRSKCKEMFGRLQTSCHIQTQPGKRTNGSTINSTSAGPQQQKLVITCTNSGRRFLVENGAHVLVVHATWINKRSSSTCQLLHEANGT